MYWGSIQKKGELLHNFLPGDDLGGLGEKRARIVIDHCDCLAAVADRGSYSRCCVNNQAMKNKGNRGAASVPDELGLSQKLIRDPEK